MSADARGRILGATMVASHAGEMISEMSLAVTAGLRLSTLAQTIHPYPTQSEAWKKLGDAWNRGRLTPVVQNCSPRGYAGVVNAMHTSPQTRAPSSCSELGTRTCMCSGTGRTATTGVTLTCISDFPVATYSGMLTGVLAGDYPASAMEVPLAPLCEAA